MRIIFDKADAADAVHEFLADPAGVGPYGERATRAIVDDQQDHVAYILDPATYNRIAEEANAWHRATAPNPDPALPPGYRPYQHAAAEDPNYTAFPPAPLLDPIAQAIYGVPYEALSQDETIRVDKAASAALLRITMEPDHSGAVPILMRPQEAESRVTPHNQRLWTVAYQTSVPGLYLRRKASPMFYETWAIITATGFYLAEGWWQRDDADRAAALIANTLPGVDWVTCTDLAAMPEQAKHALQTVITQSYSPSIPATPPPPVDWTSPVPTA